ncbi:MAG TPA: hypothetical protein VM051_01480 [Usitatibacter sp.]|nr:hypothetical protein [Usitatibacter sp.]
MRTLIKSGMRLSYQEISILIESRVERHQGRRRLEKVSFLIRTVTQHKSVVWGATDAPTIVELYFDKRGITTGLPSCRVGGMNMAIGCAGKYDEIAFAIRELVDAVGPTVGENYFRVSGEAPDVDPHCGRDHRALCRNDTPHSRTDARVHIWHGGDVAVDDWQATDVLELTSGLRLEIRRPYFDGNVPAGNLSGDRHGGSTPRSDVDSPS